MPTEQTVNSILSQRRKEVESYCKNFAVAHAKIQEMNGASLKVWLINTNELAMGSKIHFGITGNAHISPMTVGVNVLQRKTQYIVVG